MTTEGRHLICELHGGKSELLNNEGLIKELLTEAATRSGATVVGGHFHSFRPQGVTGILLLAESHISIHTWPERGYAAIDIYTCGIHTQPKKAIDYLQRAFGAMRIEVKEIRRGMQEPIASIKDNWFYEEESSELHGFSVKEWIVREKSDFQDIVILRNEFYGKILFLDGASQSAEHDEYIYHEALIHPAMMQHPSPKKVLILGGGEGASLREVLRHRTVEEAVMVDIDAKLMELCKQHLPEWSQGAFEDPRARVIAADGHDWVKNSREKFDVIIMDLTDQIDLGPSFLLYTDTFFCSLRDLLNPDGLLVIQSGILAPGDIFTHASIRKTLENTFEQTTSYAQYIPSFFSEWSFIISGRKELLPPTLPVHLEARIAERINGSLRFYQTDTHHRMFTLVPELEASLKDGGVVVKTKEQFLGSWSADRSRELHI